MPSAVASLVRLAAVLLLARTNPQTHSSPDAGASGAGKRTTLRLQLLPPMALAFRPVSSPRSTRNRRTRTRLAGQIGEPEAKKAIDKVVQALRKDSSAKTELGNLKKVENVLGYGSPQAGKIAVRFNASFSKAGKGFLGMGGGKAKDGDQRGTMVGQVKASVDEKSGKVLECSVFRDLGYGRAFNLKTK